MSRVLHLDIETIPFKEITQDDIEVPGNLKKAETIAVYIETKGLEETIKKHSVDLLRSRVLCIGAALDNEEPVCFYDADSELTTLTLFSQWFMEKLTADQRHLVTFSGFNIKGFDYPILSLRLSKYNLAIKGYVGLDINKYTRLWDLMSILTGFRYGAYYSQDAVCEFMGIPGKDDVDGSMVYSLYKQGKHEEIQEYCKRDVKKVRAIYRMFA